MITKNFKSIAAGILQATSSSTPYGLLPVTNVAGNTYYASTYFNGYPRGATESFTTTAANAGTSGLYGQVTRSVGFDGTYPYLRFDLVLTNTSSADITVQEIGFKQGVACADTQGGTGTTSRVLLIDHTVLPNPVIITAGGYQVIRYTLKTIIS